MNEHPRTPKLRRLTATICLAVTATLGLAPSVPASAAPPTVASTSASASAAADDVTPAYTAKLEWTDFRDHLSAYAIGQMRATGYGRMIPTGLKWVGTRTYQTVFRLENHDPRTLVGAAQPKPVYFSGGKISDAEGNPLPAGATPQSDFCWPWEAGYGSGAACWNDPTTWNWGKLFHYVAPSPITDRSLTMSRWDKCQSGALKAATFSVAGKAGAAVLIGRPSAAKVTPTGFVVGVIGGCIANLFH